MSKVNSLFQDQQEQQLAEWMKLHPGSTEEEAHDALWPYDGCEPDPAGEYATRFDYAVMRRR